MNLPFKLVDPGAFSNATEAFLTLSGIYLDCTAQLSWNAVVFSREAAQTCLATCKDVTTATDPSAPFTAPVKLTRSLMTRAVENTREGCDAIMQAHARSARVLRDRMIATAGVFPATDEIYDAAQMFAQMFNQISTRSDLVPGTPAQATAA